MWNKRGRRNKDNRSIDLLLIAEGYLGLDLDDRRERWRKRRVESRRRFRDLESEIRLRGERRGEERKGESNKIAINTVEDEKDPELKEGGRDNEERRNVGRKKREPKQ